MFIMLVPMGWNMRTRKVQMVMRPISPATAMWPGSLPLVCSLSGTGEAGEISEAGGTDGARKSLTPAYTAEKIRRARANHIGPVPLRKFRLRI